MKGIIPGGGLPELITPILDTATGVVERNLVHLKALLFKGVLGDKSCIKREKEEAHPCKAFLIKKCYPYEQCSSFSGRQFPDPVVRLEN